MRIPATFLQNPWKFAATSLPSGCHPASVRASEASVSKSCGFTKSERLPLQPMADRGGGAKGSGRAAMGRRLFSCGSSFARPMKQLMTGWWLASRPSQTALDCGYDNHSRHHDTGFRLSSKQIAPQKLMARNFRPPKSYHIFLPKGQASPPRIFLEVSIYFKSGPVIRATVIE
jgi:hypothetical protein